MELYDNLNAFLYGDGLTCAGKARGRVSIVSWETELALKAMGVVEAVETATIGHVTDWAQGWIHISITLTCDALTNLCGEVMS